MGVGCGVTICMEILGGGGGGGGGGCPGLSFLSSMPLKITLVYFILIGSVKMVLLYVKIVEY